MDDLTLVSALLHLKSSSTSMTETHESDKSCFSAAVETVWARDPEIAGELQGELAKQGRRRRATLTKAAEPYVSSDDQSLFTSYESTATANYINAGTQTLVDSNDAVKPRAQRRKQDDLVYRPSHSSSKSTRSRKTQLSDTENEPTTSQSEETQLGDAENEPATSQPELSSPKSPDVVDVSIKGGTRDGEFAAMAEPESAIMLETPPKSEKELTKASQDKVIAAASPALATCLFLVSNETVRCMIFDAARDIHDMEMYEGRLGGEVHQGILDSLKSDHTDGASQRLAGSNWAVSRPMDWSLTMWMNILDQGRASHKKSGILRKIEWMGASAWFDYQVEQASSAPPRTKRGIPMKRVSTAVLDRMLNEAHDDGLDATSEQPIDRKAQQRKTFIDNCSKGKRLRQIVKALGTGILFYRRIWDLLKISQDQVEDVVSHLATDPAKASTLALLGEQVELLVGNGRPNTAAFLDAVEVKSLISADDASSSCLRSQGIDHFVSLPQIIVCGDQSSGKSSVLEAISGVSFPVKGNLCTRFPTELVLRRASHVGARVSIVPHHARSESEKVTLSSFEAKLEDFQGFSALIDTAKSVMGISARGKTFAKDLLRVEISGPDRPHLTIVDLPGLIHSQTKHQTTSDVQLIQEVVESYMKEPRSIILAVVSAKNDFANQVVLKLARSADACGNRTLGIITKPDTLHPGSASEALYVSLARNEQVEFRLGWHVLKNMDSEAGSVSLNQRNALEGAFFNQGIWPELPHTVLGIDQLRRRLSKVLLSHITSELTSLVEEIESKCSACRDKLAKLGQPRLTRYDQQLFLLGISESFQRLVKSATDGDWNDFFFDDTQSDDGYQRRLRAVVQNNNDNFADRLSTTGHRRHITDSGIADLHTGIPINRVAFIEHIEAKMRSSRGRELPGLFDPMAIATLFRDQASPWKRLVHDHIESTWKACKTFLQHVVVHISDPTTSTALLQKVIGPAMHNISVALKEKTDNILKSHREIHPITYNRIFTETIQQIRAGRKRSECASVVKRFFNVTTLGPHGLNRTVDLSSLVDSLIRDTTEPDISRFAASEVLDHMEAYYKVAMKRFIDDVAVEVIEVGLVSVLVDILSPVAVYQMETELVAQIAGESEDNQSHREQLNRQLDVLGKGAEICKQFAFVKISAIMNESSNNSFNGANIGEDIAPHSESISSETSESTPKMEDLIEKSVSVESIVELAPDVVCEPEPEAAGVVCEPEPEAADAGDLRPMSSASKKKKRAKKLVGFE